MLQLHLSFQVKTLVEQGGYNCKVQLQQQNLSLNQQQNRQLSQQQNQLALLHLQVFQPLQAYRIYSASLSEQGSAELSAASSESAVTAGSEAV